MPPQQGLLEPGNIDLYKQPKVKNPDGSISTVDSSSYNIDGKEILLPSVTPDGRHLKNPKDIVDEYRKTGRHLGKFDSPNSATAYAQQLHNDYAAGKYDTPQLGQTNMPLLNENFQRFSRAQNLFGPQNPIGGQGPNLSSNMPGFPLAMNAMGGGQAPNPMSGQGPVYQPDTRASDMLFQMINQMPQRNRPGFGRKILASLSGLGGGPQAADQALYAPYYQQMQDWQAKLGPVEKVAAEERMQNANMRQLYAAMLRDQQTQRELDIKEQVAETTRKRSEAYIAMQNYKMNHPDEQMLAPKGGNYLFRNPDTGQVVDTGYSTGTLDRMQELDIQNKAAQKRAETLAAGQFMREAETRPIVDPTDPNQNVLASVNPVTGRTVPYKTAEGQPVRPVPTSRTGQPANLAVIRQMTQDALNALDNVVDKNNKLTSQARAAVGGSAVMGNLPFPTEARSGKNKIDQLRNLLTLTLITEMKNASRTGATGFGALNLRELGVLENSAGRLDRFASEKDFEDAVKEIRTRLNLIMQDPSGTGVGTGQRKFQKNSATGEVRVSDDGGKTWKPYSGK